MASKTKRAVLAAGVVPVLAAVLAITAGPASAKKPPKPPPDPDPGITNPAFAYHYDNELYVATADGSSTLKLYSRRKMNVRCPVWSPDGTRLAFLLITEPGKVWCELYTVEPDGTGLTLVRSFTTTDPYPPETMDWSPDGSKLLYSGGGGLWELDWATGAVQPLSMPGCVQPSFGPDRDPATGFQGMIAYSDGLDIYVVEVRPGTSGRLETVGSASRLDLSGYQQAPRWSRDGASIAFRDLDNGLAVVPVQTDSDGRFQGFGTASVLYSPGGGRPTWAPDSDLLAFRSTSRRLPGGGVTVDLYRITIGGAVTGPLTDGTDRDSSGHPEWNPAWTDDL
jgi:Tol biopolymer transport system component